LGKAAKIYKNEHRKLTEKRDKLFHMWEHQALNINNCQVIYLHMCPENQH